MEKKYHIPDGILRTLTCDFCHKFLSVGPVLLYPNRKINCGRCSHEGDAGVISSYELISKHLIFKCVNRYDGCRQLLSYAEAENHELTCKSKAYVCPVCPDNEEIPTFLFIKHFRESHADCFLETTSFEVKMSSHCTKIHLHEAKDNLFFIKYSTCSASTISLSAILLGEQERAGGITQKWTLHSHDGSGTVKTELRNCGSVGHAYSGEFQVAKPRGDMVTVMFELYIQEFLKSPSEKRIGLPRNIIVSAEIHQKYPGVFVRLSSSSLFLKSNNSQILLHCFCCSLISTKYRPFISNFLILGMLKYQYICDSCHIYRERALNLYPSLYWNQLVWSPGELEPLYSCAWQPWGCSESFNNIEIHEIECPHQPLHLCPVYSCDYKGKLSNLPIHFKDFHTTDFIHLQCSVSVICRASFGTHYIWTEHGFVSLKISEINPQYVQISLCPLLESLDRHLRKSTLRVLLVSKENLQFTEFLTVGIPCVTNIHSINILCYFDN